MSKRSNSSDAMIKFLKDRVESNQGLSLQKLTGHLSQLPPDLRTKFGSSVKDLKLFLLKFPEVFVISNNSDVYLRTKSRQVTSSQNDCVESPITATSDHSANEKDLTFLTDAQGTVYRMFTLYGFISTEAPVKTSVYFDVQSFENAQYTNLPPSGLKVGESVIFDAKIGPKDCKAKFRATRVTRVTPTMPPSSPGLSPKSANNGGDGDCDTAAHLVNQDGVIETVKSNYGFIKFGLNQKERAFFHANKVEKSLGKPIKNLPDVFKVEDKVRFDAKPSMKPSDKVKWEATTVHLCRSSDRNGATDMEEFSGNEVFMSDDECDLQDLLKGELEEYQSRETGFKASTVGYGDGDSSLVNLDYCNSTVKGNRNGRRLFGERGFFYPATESTGTIKFGPSREFTACAAVEVTYRDEEPIDNLLWEVPDDQEVSFDAVQTENNSWTATLVWIGQRPAHPRVEDREDVFNKVIDKTRDAQKQLPDADSETCGNAGGQKTHQNMGLGSVLDQPSITTYKSVKGVIIKVMECTGTCKVQELAGSRKVNFTSESFYKDGTMYLGYLNDVLRAGDTVFLDYMVGVYGRKEEIRCDLVWLGRRPKEARQMSPDEFRQMLHIETRDGEKLRFFKDFETGMDKADEASRGPYEVSSDTGLPDDTVLGRGSGASLSVSLAGLLVAPPNTPTNMWSPGAHDESSAGENVPDESFLWADLNDEVLLQLAESLAEKIIAESKGMGATFRDIGVQTTYEESSYSRPDLLVPILVCSSAQTISTGGIMSPGLFPN